MHLYNADVVKKFIFRYLSVPLTDGYWNIFMDITNKDIPNKLSLRVVDELNKFLSNVCIILVNYGIVFLKESLFLSMLFYLLTNLDGRSDHYY
jgi:hypothetical protein